MGAITDKRGKVVHLAGADGRPMCRPNSKVKFHATLIGFNGSRLCGTCAERDLRAQFDAAGLSGGPIDA